MARCTGTASEVITGIDMVPPPIPISAEKNPIKPDITISIGRAFGRIEPERYTPLQVGAPCGRRDVGATGSREGLQRSLLVSYSR